ncbi:MAG: cell wall hydrolase [Lachnospiraceae bacterium]
MITKEKKRILRSVLAAAVSAVTIASMTVPAYSAPSAKELEITTSDLKDDLNDLNSQLSSLSAELDNASAQIEELSAEVEKAKLDLAAAQLNEELQYDAMKNRIKFMYEGGNISLLEILFSSDSMGDFLNKAEYVTTISEYDRNMLEELKEVCASVEKKQTELKNKQDELAVMQVDLTNKRDALTSKISSTSSQLEDYTAQLERARAAEEALRIAQNNAISGALKPSGNTGQAGNNGGGQTNSQQPGNNQPGAEQPGNNTGSNNPGTVTPPTNVSDVVLFAALLQCEAGGYDPMLAVATVVMNRVASPSYPNTLRGVIYQSGQFSPTWNGSLERVLAAGPSSTAYSVAQAALGGARHNDVINCYQFRSAASTSHTGINIGGNIFF